MSNNYFKILSSSLPILVNEEKNNIDYPSEINDDLEVFEKKDEKKE